MWRKIQGVESLEEAIKAIASGVAKSVRATVEYEGREYTATFEPKIPDATPVQPVASAPALPSSFDAMRLSRELGSLLLGPEGMMAVDELPWLTLPPGYSFKVTFPFSGAAARFRVCRTDQPERIISVYLDTRDVLGYVGQPYWEAYPIAGETARFLLAESEELVAAIVGELEGDVPLGEPAPV
ncbi:hypothetical protein TA3x_000417 [Tundrisphaera sp. TA3]|uniref:hypothetical protein n=1 Tax=Tundrisphaera sp. TA3 TaxID=3435775 RepID=UPI003EBF33D0